MPDHIEFETPENVLVSYRPAGLGSRFTALVLDYLLLLAAMVVLFFIIAGLAALSATSSRWVERQLSGLEKGQINDLPLYFWGFFILVWGLGSFFYFGLSEYFMRGQTLGKRWLNIRVVKVNGFSLDASSVFLRNIFRVVENLFFPPLWLVPFLSKNSQRLGDMVAGTVLISDVPAQIGTLRERLLKNSPADAFFRFDATALQRARPADVEAIERILDRLADLRTSERVKLLQNICDSLAKRLTLDPPAPEQRIRFLEEFLAAEYRRQHRQLG